MRTHVLAKALEEGWILGSTDILGFALMDGVMLGIVDGSPDNEGASLGIKDGSTDILGATDNEGASDGCMLGSCDNEGASEGASLGCMLGSFDARLASVQTFPSLSLSF